MYAVIKTGGKQYKVAPGGLVAVAKIAGDAGDTVAFEEVLLVGGENDTTLGSPLVSGAAVAGEIVGQKRTAKIIVFKKRRRQNSKRTRGHRQDQTIVRITEILTDGRKPEMKKAAPAVEASAEEAAAKPKRAPRKTAEAAGETKAAAKPARKTRAKAAKSEDQE
jgi:large subunit ribosomal protein L21